MKQVAMFGAGCFWGVEELYRQTPGVVATSVGYAGGRTENPTYKQVCYEETGHAEVVHITFDPEVVSYGSLLELFWENHDPTTLNRQGADIGTQYRSVIFVYDEEQAAIAKASRESAQARYARPIVTEISPAPVFNAAEEYHQQYLAKRGMSSCHI